MLCAHCTHRDGIQKGASFRVGLCGPVLSRFIIIITYLKRNFSVLRLGVAVMGAHWISDDGRHGAPSVSSG